MTEKEIRELWEWCEVDFYESDGSPKFWARTPSGGVVELKVDLNNLFLYAVPKLERKFILIEWIIRLVMDWAVGKEVDAATALFRAVQKVMINDKVPQN